jgi:hypothetical protein
VRKGAAARLTQDFRRRQVLRNTLKEGRLKPCLRDYRALRRVAWFHTVRLERQGRAPARHPCDENAVSRASSLAVQRSIVHNAGSKSAFFPHRNREFPDVGHSGRSECFCIPTQGCSYTAQVSSHPGTPQLYCRCYTRSATVDSSDDRALSRLCSTLLHKLSGSRPVRVVRDPRHAVAMAALRSAAHCQCQRTSVDLGR